MNRFRVIIIFSVMTLYISSSYGAKHDFFEQRYRGWLWFEEKEQDNSMDSQAEEQAMSRMPTEEQMKQAKLENEAFKEELEALRHLMVRYPNNLNYIRLYKEKEKQMLDGAMLLARNFAMVNFLNPSIADQLKRPQNIYGRNVARGKLSSLPIT